MSTQVIGTGRHPGQTCEVPWPIVSAATEKPLLAPCMVTKAAYYRDARGHWIERAWIEEYVVQYCVGGRGWLRYRDREIAVNTGDIMAVPLEAHAYGSDPDAPWSVHWAHLRGADVGPLLALAGITADHPLRAVGLQPELITHFQRLHAAARAGVEDAHLLQAAAHARLMLAYLILLQRDGDTASSRVSAAVAHMQAHLDAPLTLADMAASTGLSVPHFSRLFRRQFGRSPVDYFLHLKVGVAREQLATTDLTVVVIARQLGYRDPYYFSRLFKTQVGLSPTAYRAQHRRRA